MFGYINHAGIDRTHGFIRGWAVTSAAAHDGAQLRNVVAKDNTASTVWADSAYRSKINEERLKDNRLTSDIHQRKQKGKPMSEAVSRANSRRSKILSAVEHVFARQKDQMKLFIRTIGISRAKAKSRQQASGRSPDHEFRVNSRSPVGLSKRPASDWSPSCTMFLISAW